MSRSFLEGVPEEVFGQEHDYQQGSSSYGIQLAKEMVGLYAERFGTNGFQPASFGEQIEALIVAEGHPIGQGFLDNLLWALEDVNESLRYNSYVLLNPAIQGAYHSGERKLFLDLTSIGNSSPDYPSLEVATGVRASKDAPLRLSIKPPAQRNALPWHYGSVGKDSHSLIISLDGRAGSVGEDSYWGEYVVRERPQQLGKGSAFHNSFLLYDPLRQGSMKIIDDYDRPFRLEQPGVEEKDALRLERTFFDRGNHLYLSRDGYWQEVRP